MEEMAQKVTMLAVIAVALIGGLFLLKRVSGAGDKKTRWTIGIIQTATHPALDDTRKGFVEVLKEMGVDVSFIVKNGEGSSSQLHAIAEQFHARPHINALFAIATPAVQAAAAVEREKPLIIAAVTDPQQLGIISPTTNVSGTSDMINVEQEVHSMKLLLPKVKTVSIIYSPSEINATIVAQKMKEAVEKEGMTPRLVPLTSQADIVGALTSALSKSDALLAPTDNLIASAITVIADMARKARKPLIVSDNTLVKYGALMAQGVNYYESGKESGRIAYEILVGQKKPAQIPVVSGGSSKLFINKDVLNELGLSMPQELQSSAVLVGTGVGN